MFPRGHGYKYSNTRMIIVKRENGAHQFMKGDKGFRLRDNHMEFKNLEKGDYAVYVEVDWEEDTKDRVFCITSYGKSKVSFGECNSSTPKEDILRPIFKSKAMLAEKSPKEFPDVSISNYRDDYGPLIKRYECNKSVEGYYWILVVNGEEEATF